MSYSEAYFTARESWRDWGIEASELIRLANVTPGVRVLEIGCGGGGLLRMLHERGASVVGIDALNVALNLARRRDVALQRLYVVQIGADITLPFRDASFDAIIGQHVVEHLPDVSAALREWKRLLKPNGRIALATPNARYPDPAHFADAGHTQVFSPAELRGVVERAGLGVESCYTVFPFLSRLRGLRALGVLAYKFFQHAPSFASRGRTILLNAKLA